MRVFSILFLQYKCVKSYPEGLAKSPFDRKTRLTVVKSKNRLFNEPLVACVTKGD